MKTWRDIEDLSNRNQLSRLIEEEYTPTRIARKLGCSVTSVKHAMRFHGLKTKKYIVGEKMKELLKL